MSSVARGRTLLVPLFLAAISLPAGQALAKSPPTGVVPAPAATSRGPVHALVELQQQPTAAAYRTQATASGTALAAKAAVNQLAVVRAEQATFQRQMAAARIAGTSEVYRLQRSFNGILYVTTEAGLAALRALPGVKAVHVMTPLTLDNAHSVPLIGVPQLWSNPGLPLHGEGMRVGVIDTGIDYTHANFGGTGIPADYTAIDKSAPAPAGVFPSVKVVGGWDFAGASYNAAAAATAIPTPDANPLDGNGHGSHVSGTIAGYGVTAGLATYTGAYDSALDTTTFSIGPGVAPAASLYALKVFGDGGGSTSLAALAVEWAMDPNGDGNFADHLDVVNLSLGSSYGTSNDAEARIYSNAVAAGVTVVASAGNAGSFYFITGAPASTPEVISVAASTVGTHSGLIVNAPASIAGQKKLGFATFGPSIPTNLTGDVAAAVPASACANATTGSVTNDLTGKIALVVRGTCSFDVKTKAAQDAGAIAVVIYDNRVEEPLTMGVSNPALAATITVPSRFITQADGTAIQAELTAANTVNITMNDGIVFVIPAEADQIASFSSRGPSRLKGQPILKPDLAAPGVSIISTAMGTGTGNANFNGTSMAAPHVSGVAALLRQLHPTWTPAEIKALLMNTAGHDLFNAPSGAAGRLRVGLGQAGAGRVDAALAASAPVVAYDKASPGRVSVSFAAGDVSGPTTEARTVQLKNKGAASITYDATLVNVTTAPGTAVAITGSSPVTVAAGATADLTIQLTADPATMVLARDQVVPATTVSASLPRYWLSETTGTVVLTPQGTGNGPVLRVPFYAALTPASSMRSSGQLSTHGASAGTASLFLQGSGVDTRQISATTGVVSLVTPMELAWSSPQAALSQADHARLAHVGVTSNLPDMATIANFAEIYFGLNTYGRWGSPRDVEFDVYIKKSAATDWEYVLYNTDYGATSANPGTDVHMTALVNLTTGAGRYEDFANGLDQTTFRLPLFLSDTLMLPVIASDLGLVDGGPGGIDFQVLTWDSNGVNVDQSPILHYDLTRPAFAVGADPSTGLAGNGYAPVWVDQAGRTVPVAYDVNRQVNPSTGMLLLHHHNAFGARAEAVPVVKAQELVAMTALAVGSAACPNGGIHVASGFDDNNNAVLDAVEVLTAYDICNGVNGTNGLTALVRTSAEPAGANCGAGGVKVELGLDANANGVLDTAEVDAAQTRFICNGSSGALVKTSTEPAGSHCAAGGVKIETGLDANGNGVLDAGEIDAAATQYVCNGATGSTGPAGPPGPKGSGGCTSFGDAPSVASLIGLLALLRRRRRG